MGQKSPLNPDDIFIRRIQNNLLHHSLAGWRRRGKMLLDINCGGGRFLRSLWHSGFDVTATEENFKYRQHAAHIMKGVAEIYAAHPTHLPFEDDFFDWAVLHLEALQKEDLEAAIKEAFRVAAHGLAVTFWNASAPVFLFNSNMASIKWWKVYTAIRNLNMGKIALRSTLLFPFTFFRKRCPRLFFNAWQTPFPLGAWMVIRLDLSQRSTVTPLGLRAPFKKIGNFIPALEYRSQRGRS